MKPGLNTTQLLAEQYGLEAIELFLYTPADPQPLNAYLVTGLDCEVGINKDGMYPVSEKGLVNDITKYLQERRPAERAGERRAGQASPRGGTAGLEQTGTGRVIRCF